MGIKNFHKFLRKHFPDVYYEIPLANLTIKKIAIDINIYLFKYKSIHKDKWIGIFFSFLLLLKKYNFDCVCIYDSKAPVEKDAKKLERRRQKKKAEQRLQEIEKCLLSYQENGSIDPLLYQISQKRGTLQKILNPSDKVLDMEAINRELQLLSNQIVNITKIEVDLSKELLDILGIPYYVADGEAESLCAYMCCHNIVDAVLSDDTDVIVYGTPLFLTKLNMRNETCFVIDPKSVINNLKLTFEQFVDLCIMSGTDYNDNIPNIGNEKAYNLLLKYDNLETIELEKPDLNVHVLNFKRIRELFRVPSTIEDYIIENRKANIDLLNTFTIKHRIPINADRIRVLL